MPRVSNFEFLKQIEQPVLLMQVNTSLTDLPKQIGEGFMKIGSYLNELGEMPADIPFVAFHDFDTMSEQNMKVEIGIPVSKEMEGKGDIKFTVLPSKTVVFCMYRGSYGELMPVYELMLDWIKGKGYKPHTVAYESYYSGLGFPESEMLTKITIPVEKA